MLKVTQSNGSGDQQTKEVTALDIMKALAHEHEVNPEMIEDLRAVFELLSNNIRLRIAILLSRGEEKNLHEISEYTNQSQPTVSYHLSLMKKKDLVNVRHDKTYHYYSIGPQIPKILKSIATSSIKGGPEKLAEVGDRIYARVMETLPTEFRDAWRDEWWPNEKEYILETLLPENGNGVEATALEVVRLMTQTANS